MKSKYPTWAIRHRKPGTEIKFIRGNYYLYKYKTVYDRSKKSPKKISGKLIGSITREDGLVPSSKRELERSLKETSFSELYCKEYGVSYLVNNTFSKYCNVLKDIFPDYWKKILGIAYCRFIYHCPLKNIPYHLAQSFLPHLLKIESFNEKTASNVLKTIGGMPAQRLAYMKSFILKDDYLLIDATHVFSNSDLMKISRIGYNNDLNFDPQFNLMYIYSSKTKVPVYYRILPGNIREVKAFKNSLIEAGLNKAVIITDKGFYSKKNVNLLQDEGLKFIMPLKRDNKLIDYSTLTNNTFKNEDAFFEHEKRFIWFRKYNIDNDLWLFLFLNDVLKVQEEKDYLTRIFTHPEEYTQKQYHNKRNTFGTIALLSNLKRKSAIDVFQTYKSRMTIELLFDGMKNELEADHTYMQDEQTLQGWMFVNHITIQWYWYLYIELKEKGLLKKYSVNDYIRLLTDIKKIKINGSWHFNEITAYSARMMKKLGITIQ
jgi:transposase